MELANGLPKFPRNPKCLLVSGEFLGYRLFWISDYPWSPFCLHVQFGFITVFGKRFAKISQKSKMPLSLWGISEIDTLDLVTKNTRSRGQKKK